jgi:DNA polymerase-3 subunit beta
MTHATLNARALSALNLAVSTEETRYYLNGVLVEIEAGSVTYCATDGHILAAFREASEVENTLIGHFIIPRATCAALKLGKSPDKALNAAIMTPIGGRKYELETQRASLLFEPIDGSFPEWRGVIPATTDGKIAQFNPEKLVQVQKVARILFGATKGQPCTPRIFHNGDGPIMCGWAGVPDLLAAVMPLASKGKSALAGEPLPAWFTPHKTPVSVAAE